MNALKQDETYTIEDIYALPDGVRAELIDGKKRGRADFPVLPLSLASILFNIPFFQQPYTAI